MTDPVLNMKKAVAKIDAAIGLLGDSACSLEESDMSKHLRKLYKLHNYWLETLEKTAESIEMQLGDYE